MTETKKGRRRIRVDLQLLTKVLFPRGYQRAQTITNSLPADVSIIGIKEDVETQMQGWCWVLLESSEWQEVPLGQLIPELEPPTIAVEYPPNDWRDPDRYDYDPSKLRV